MRNKYIYKLNEKIKNNFNTFLYLTMINSILLSILILTMVFLAIYSNNNITIQINHIGGIYEILIDVVVSIYFIIIAIIPTIYVLRKKVILLFR